MSLKDIIKELQRIETEAEITRERSYSLRKRLEAVSPASASLLESEDSDLENIKLEVSRRHKRKQAKRIKIQ